MSKKNTIRLTESELKKVITETVKNVLKENRGHMEDVKGDMWQAFYDLGQAIQQTGCGNDSKVGDAYERLRGTMDTVAQLLNDYYMQLYAYGTR